VEKENRLWKKNEKKHFSFLESKAEITYQGLKIRQKSVMKLSPLNDML